MAVPPPSGPQIGSLGEIPFSVVRQPSRASRTRSWGYAVHELAAAQAVVEATGRAPDAVRLQIRLVAVTAGPGLEVSPQEDLDALVRMAETRRAQSLFVGAALWGWFVVESIDDDTRRVAPDGTLLSVDVSLTLKGVTPPAD